MNAIRTLSFSLLLSTTPALAIGTGQDYNGTYDLECAVASVGVLVDVAGDLDGVSASYQDSLGIDVGCEVGVDEDQLAEVHDQVLAACTDSGLSESLCAALAGDISAAVGDMNDLVMPYVPESIDLAVNAPAYEIGLNAYPASAVYWLENGAMELWSYMIETTGEFNGQGISAVNNTLSSTLGCTDAATGGASGSIDPETGSMDVDLSTDRTLVCAASDGAGTIAGVIELMYMTQASGQR